MRGTRVRAKKKKNPQGPHVPVCEASAILAEATPVLEQARSASLPQRGRVKRRVRVFPVSRLACVDRSANSPLVDQVGIPARRRMSAARSCPSPRQAELTWRESQSGTVPAPKARRARRQDEEVPRARATEVQVGASDPADPHPPPRARSPSRAWSPADSRAATCESGSGPAIPPPPSSGTPVRGCGATTRRIRFREGSLCFRTKGRESNAPE